MKLEKLFLFSSMLIFGLIICQCINEEFCEQTQEPILKKGTKPVPEESEGNCLSFPVIWAEGTQKTLRGVPGMEPVLDGEWWYWWGIEGEDPATTVIYSAPPDPDDVAYYDNGISDSLDTDNLADPTWVKAYLQKDVDNVWQAEHKSGSANPVIVNLIDWGDNLESLPWNLRSQVRTEVVLYKNLGSPMKEFEMRHVSGWGIEEVHGLAVKNDGSKMVLSRPSNQATVYSSCARLTIQKLIVPREELSNDSLVWIPEKGWKEAEGVNGDYIRDSTLFNEPVSKALDGPGYYNAEVNVKGKIIYGYTWNVRSMNDGAGDYRITFSFDAEGKDAVPLNTFFQEGTTEILIPVEVIIESDDADHGGGVAKISFNDNLTYIDITIDEKSGGGNKK